MTSAPEPRYRPLVVGANHRSSSMTLRDRLFVEDAEVPSFLAGLRQAGLEQCLIMSTCDRVEIQAVHPDPEAAAEIAIGHLAARIGLRPGDFGAQVYHLIEAAAVRQIFAVASSLDSLVIGEPQVLSQLKAAHRLAQESGTVGSDLEALMQAAYGAAKRVRTETRIGEGPVSIAAAAVQIGRDVHGDLAACQGLLIGAGDMGELIGEALINVGIGQLQVVHPMETRAEATARLLDCHRASFADLPHLLEGADIVVTSLNGRTHSLDKARVRSAIKARRRKPIFVVDAGIPGDVDPEVNQLDEAFLYDLNDLERVAMAGRASREQEARAAAEVIDDEVAAFLQGRSERTGAPTVAALRQHFEEIRQQVLAECGDDAEKATHLLVNRLLHSPSEATRQLAASQDADDGSDWQMAQRLLRRLFRLEGGNRSSGKD